MLQRRSLAAQALLFVLAVGACSGGEPPQATLAPAHGGTLPLLEADATDPPPRQLMGLNTSQVVALLGPAEFRRADGPAEILQYRGPTCIMDVFLYQASGTPAYQVAHVEARNDQQSRVAATGCFQTISPRHGAG